MQSKATSVRQYLRELPAARREAIEAVRAVILENLDGDYEEGMQYGMIGYYVPHRVYPPGYHCDPKQPLPFTCLASQKNHLSLYLGCVYGEHDTARWFREAWAMSGKKLDMGKTCIRFQKAEDLAPDVIGEVIRRTPVNVFIAYYESVIKDGRRGKPKKTARKSSSPRGSKASSRSTSPKRRSTKR